LSFHLFLLSLPSCLAETTNPYLWAGYTGNDFLPNHAVDGKSFVFELSVFFLF